MKNFSTFLNEQKLNESSGAAFPKYKIGLEPKFKSKEKQEIANKIRAFIKIHPDLIRDFHYPANGKDSTSFKGNTLMKVKCTNQSSLLKLYHYLATFFSCEISGKNLKISNPNYIFAVNFSSGRGFYFNDEKTQSTPSTATQETGTIIALKYFAKHRDFIKPVILNELAKFNFDAKWQKSFVYQVNAINDFISITSSMGIDLDSDSKSIGHIIFKKFKKLGFNGAKDNWNPADIWIYNQSYKQNILTKLDKAKNLVEFNIIMKELFKDRILIGVSLKKALKPTIAKTIDNTQINSFGIKFDKSTMSLKNTYFDIQTKGFPKNFMIRARAKAKSITKESDIKIYFEGKLKNSTEFLGAIPKSKFSSLLPNSDKPPKEVDYQMMKQLIGEVQAQGYMKITDLDSLDFTDELKIKYMYVLVRYLKYIYSIDEQYLTELAMAGFKMNNYSSIHIKVGG